MKKLFLTPKYFAFIALSLLLPIALISAWVWLSFFVQKELITAADITTQTLILEQERSRRDQSQHILSTDIQDIKRINDFFADHQRPVQFLQDMEQTAELTSNNLLITPGSGEQIENTLAFNFEIDGTAQSVFQFLRALEYAPYSITTNEFTFQRLSPKTDAIAQGAPTARLNVSIRVATRVSKDL